MRPYLILRSPDLDPIGGPSTEEIVMISREELDELRAKADGTLVTRVVPDRSSEPRDDIAGRLKALESEHSREIAARDQKAAELERAYKGALRDRELATALVGKPLVPGAAAQLIKLWRDDFEVIDEDGEIRVLSRDGRSVDQEVIDRLAGSDFAHFSLPSSRGGTGAKGQNRSASSPVPSEPAAPRTLGEAVLQKWRESTARPQSAPTPTGWGRRR